MATNPWFNNYAHSGQQALINSLVLESIKQYGYDVYYIPRTIGDEDKLLTEDRFSTFNAAATVEVYIKNVEGFEGEGDFLSRFNLEIRDSVTFTMAKTRFEQIRTESMLTQEHWNMLQEDGSKILLEGGNADDYVITSSRPLEGDLIYFPLNDKLFEIKFVEHEPVFYQMGGLQMYDLRCELFEYSSETITTGVTEIDVIETDNTLDILNFEMLQQDGFRMLQENGDAILIEFDMRDISTLADNDLLEDEASRLIDFSETNPFSEDW